MTAEALRRLIYRALRLNYSEQKQAEKFVQECRAGCPPIPAIEAVMK
jgi:hypothetical protein